MDRYVWSFDGVKFSDSTPLEFTLGERLRIVLVNDTMMEHPIHLHGMWSDVEDEDGAFLVRKHTLSIPPGTKRSYRVTADAPGRWAYHCHLVFHMASGHVSRGARGMNNAMRTALLAAILAPVSHAGDTMSMTDHMNDDPVEYMVLLDRLEIRDASPASPFVWDAKAWVGRDRNRLYLRSEGEVANGSTDEATVEALWARPVSRWWNLALGVREDFRPGDSRRLAGGGCHGPGAVQVQRAGNGLPGRRRTNGTARRD